MNVVNSGGNKYLLNGETTYNANRKYGLNTGTYTITGVPSGHPLAILNAGQTNNITYSGSSSNVLSQTVDDTQYDFYYGDVTVTVTGDFNEVSLYCYYHGYMGGENLLVFSSTCTSPPEPTPPAPEPIDIYVSSGSFSSPYYNFYTDAAGTTQLSNRTLNTNNVYRFRRLNNASSHAFYISDNGYEQSASSAITLEGDGSAASGIYGTQEFTLTFNSVPTYLYYYCTAHSSMISLFNLTSDSAA